MMLWESLSETINAKPRVLAGPMLRKVTPTSVTVWLALRKPGSVTLLVLDPSKTKVMEGKLRAVSIGKNLHIVAVTATLMSGKPQLTEGNIYQYDLSFDFDDNLSTDLGTATAGAKLSYPPFGLPSFALPPTDPNHLRLIHGSCRKPHGESIDMLPFVSDLIEKSASNAFARPHQLLLTGDQIYADDVSAGMLLMLSDAADVLLDWKEKFPSFPWGDRDLTASEIPPLVRWILLKEAGFTSEQLDSHLLSLGEYLSMYLFVWSDVLWPDVVPSYPDVLASLEKNMPPEYLKNRRRLIARKHKDGVNAHASVLNTFRSTLGKVRLALANIPSYMIFDDHEVTDDWNMTRQICRDLYGKPFGQKVTRNALVAYALCQHWGNAPEQFVTSTPPTPGGTLRVQLDTKDPIKPGAFAGKADEMSGLEGMITGLVGLHSDSELRNRPNAGLFHDPDSLQYHYTVRGPGHQVIFTDTRTWRSFPRGKNESSDIFTSDIFTDDQFHNQIVSAPDPEHRVLFVVLSTNAPPVEPIRAATRHARLSKTFKHHPDVYEAWEIESVAFDRLITAITTKIPLDENSRHVGHAILLSGDVHMGFSSTLAYQATRRFEDNTNPKPATAIIAQLVSSAFKNEDGDTRGFIEQGYTYAPAKVKWIGLIQIHQPQYFAGWNVSKNGTGEIVGSQHIPRAGVADFELEQQTIQLNKEFPRNDSRSITLSKTPDFRYRLEYLLPVINEIQLDIPALPPLPVGTSIDERKAAAARFRAVALAKRDLHQKVLPKVVGVNNFGEITFVWPTSENKQVNHALHWFDNRSKRREITTYPISLNPKDKKYGVEP